MEEYLERQSQWKASIERTLDIMHKHMMSQDKQIEGLQTQIGQLLLVIKEMEKVLKIHQAIIEK